MHFSAASQIILKRMHGKVMERSSPGKYVALLIGCMTQRVTHESGSREFSTIKAPFSACLGRDIIETQAVTSMILGLRCCTPGCYMGHSLIGSMFKIC